MTKKETFEEKKKRTDAEGRLVSIMSRKYLFSGRDSFMMRGMHLDGEPRLVDQITINGEEWELWEGHFVGEGCFGGHDFHLCMQHVPKDPKSFNILDYQKILIPMLGSRYEDWKWYLETHKKETLVDHLARYINKEFHGGILSKEGK